MSRFGEFSFVVFGGRGGCHDCFQEPLHLCGYWAIRTLRILKEKCLKPADSSRGVKVMHAGLKLFLVYGLLWIVLSKREEHKGFSEHTQSRVSHRMVTSQVQKPGGQ